MREAGRLRQLLLGATCGLLLAGPAVADPPPGGEINPFLQGETGLTTPPPCGPRNARLKGRVTSAGEPLESASIHLTHGKVPLRRAKVGISDQQGGFFLCFDTTGRHSLTVLAPGYRKFVRRLVIKPDQPLEVVVDLKPAKKGARDACKQLGGEWLCSSKICPPEELRVAGRPRQPFEGCLDCCLPGAEDACLAARPCPCNCTFTGFRWPAKPKGGKK